MSTDSKLSVSAHRVAPAPIASVAAGAVFAEPAAGRWQVRLLGGLLLSDGLEHFTRLPSRAATVLLARLALQPERAHAREELVELLWPGVALDVGRNRLRQTLSVLKALLEPPSRVAAPVLLADRLSIRVAANALACDAREFERLVRAGQPALALVLYRGELLPGFYDEWVADERTRLAALFDRIEGFATVASDAAPDASARRRVVSPVPTPAPTLGLASTGAPVHGMPGTTLPNYLTRFFGADEQAVRLRGQVLAHRLVTLVGPGGSGKTRLAVELAHGLREPMPWQPAPGDAALPFDLVVFVPWVQCTTGAQALDALLAALQIKPQGSDALWLLAQALAGRRVLLVLDNAEQMRAEAARIAGELTARLPRLHLLVTSRHALELDGEREFAVSALELPTPATPLEEAAANPALALFVDRARAVRADFHLSAHNLAPMIELVRVLDGMPLAIELAAARVRGFALAEMVALLRASAGPGTPGLDLLARSGPRGGLDPRHASMQRVIDWSWAQLAPESAQLLSALTVFHGGFGVEAVASVCAGARPLTAAAAHLLLDALRAHSLLRVHAGDASPVRFSVSEPIREFAAARLAEPRARALRAAHRAWLMRWAAGLGVSPSLPAVHAEMANLLAAFSGAVADGVPDEALRLVVALRGPLNDVSLPSGALAALTRALAQVQDQALKSRASTLLGVLSFHAGQGAEAVALVARALLLAGADPALRSAALHADATVRWRADRNAEGLIEQIDEAQALAESQPDLELLASISALRAYIANVRDRDHARGEALHRQALQIWERSGNLQAINSGRYNLAICAFNGHRYAEALLQLDPVCATALAQADWQQLSQAHNVRGNALAALRRWPEAVAAYRDSVRTSWGTTELHALAYGLWNIPRSLAHVGRPEAAARVMGFAANLWRSHFGALAASDRADVKRVQRLVAVQTGPARRVALWAEGERLSLAEAVGLVLMPGDR